MSAELGEDHRHCKVCGKVVPPGEEVCSKVCRRKREENLQSRKNLMYLIYFGIFIVIVFTVLNYAR
jgi:predicted nucleic acid-binding Zn ribbon protein